MADPIPVLRRFLRTPAGVPSDDDSEYRSQLPVTACRELSDSKSILQVWTVMHLAFPEVHQERDQYGRGGRFKAWLVGIFGPPHAAHNPYSRFAFSLFYTVAHIFSLVNTLIYWAVLVPSGHGGFKPPEFPHSHGPAHGNATALYDPGEYPPSP
jgi:hypothetical protein